MFCPRFATKVRLDPSSNASGNGLNIGNVGKVVASGNGLITGGVGKVIGSGDGLITGGVGKSGSLATGT